LSQKEAIEKVFKSNITIIEGPPGTGKTQTILNIIANLAIMRDETVAVVSNNNSAIQNVKDKLEKEGYGSFVALL
jgi:superfamily II DNA or RNA helicase